MATYEARRSLMEGPSTYELSGETLVRTVDGASKQQTTLADVRAVRINYQPVGVVPFWICQVRTHHGTISIPSANFTGFGRAQDQRAAFRPFVQALTSAIAAQPRTPPVAFTRGGGGMRAFWLGMVIIFAVMTLLLLLGAIGSLTSGGTPTWVVTPGFVMLVAGPMSWRMWRANPPGSFDPNDLPPDIAGG
jgi:hypothetical protein